MTSTLSASNFNLLPPVNFSNLRETYPRSFWMRRLSSFYIICFLTGYVDSLLDVSASCKQGRTTEQSLSDLEVSLVVISEKEMDCDGGGWKFVGASSAKEIPRDD